MTKTITVKGVGSVSAAPDYVTISMELESKDMDYETAMNVAAENISHLNRALATVGFEKEAVKTTNFNVRTDYEYQKKDGVNQRVFIGYVIEHSLKVEFDFDSKRLTNALSAVGSCIAHPQLSIAFTVKDATAIQEEMLRSAAANAKRKAEVLCDASGKVLGDLISIDYNWGEQNVRSRTRYEMADECLGAAMVKNQVEIAPQNIDLRDTATFVWEIC